MRQLVTREEALEVLAIVKRHIPVGDESWAVVRLARYIDERSAQEAADELVRAKARLHDAMNEYQRTGLAASGSPGAMKAYAAAQDEVRLAQAALRALEAKAGK